MPQRNELTVEKLNGLIEVNEKELARLGSVLVRQATELSKLLTEHPKGDYSSSIEGMQNTQQRILALYAKRETLSSLRASILY